MLLIFSFGSWSKLASKALIIDHEYVIVVLGDMHHGMSMSFFAGCHLLNHKLSVFYCMVYHISLWFMEKVTIHGIYSHAHL